MSDFPPREQMLIDLCAKHGMHPKDAHHELFALFVQGNKGSYTARVRAILSSEGLDTP